MDLDDEEFDEEGFDEEEEEGGKHGPKVAKPKPKRKVDPSKIDPESPSGTQYEIPPGKWMVPVCKCPQCGGMDMDQVRLVDDLYGPKGKVPARFMKCRADGTVFYCKVEKKKPKCECPVCHATPKKGLTVLKEEKFPGGTIVHYSCNKGHLPPVPCPNGVKDPATGHVCVVDCISPPEKAKCECPKCGNADKKLFKELDRQPMPDGKTFMVTFECQKKDGAGKICGEQFQCLLQDGGGDCKCPTCGKFNVKELGREKIMSGPEGDVWLVHYECKDDGTKFDCQVKKGPDCCCPACGDKEHRTELGRTKNADGSVVIKYKCNAKDAAGAECGEEYECVVKACDCQCKCPACGTPVDEKSADFEKLGERSAESGEIIVTYRHIPDDTTFECTKKKEEKLPCHCPECESTNFEEVSRRTVMGQIVVTFKCLACGFEPFDCVLGEPCFCKTCADSKNLEEISRDEMAGGALVHFKCTLGHLDRDEPCSRGIDGCVACCIEGGGGKPVVCQCPQCKAKVGQVPGLVSLGPPTDEVDDEGKHTKVSHYKCTKCNYVRGQCSAGYELEEAVECGTVDPKLPKCPECGTHNVSAVGMSKDGKGKIWQCNECPKEQGPHVEE